MLPVIDISALACGGPAARRAVAERIGTTCETVGFMYVAGHGVPDDVIADARSAMAAFFARPEAEKRRLAKREGVYRGYLPVSPFGRNRKGTPLALYEGFVLGEDAATDDPEVSATGGLYGPNVWPDQPAGFRPAIEAYWQALDTVSRRLLGAFALALGQDDDLLARLFDRQLTNISLLHYLARPTAGDASPDDMAAHRDTNAFTVLLPSPVGGLEVQRPDGSFAEVPAEPGCFVVNIGNMMECWSGGRFRSTMHRVHPPRGRERFSIGFFAVPRYDTVVEPLPGLPVTGAADDMARPEQGPSPSHGCRRGPLPLPLTRARGKEVRQAPLPLAGEGGTRRAATGG